MSRRRPLLPIIAPFLETHLRASGVAKHPRSEAEGRAAACPELIGRAVALSLSKRYRDPVEGFAGAGVGPFLDCKSSVFYAATA
jgi:hypothetical protein